MTAATKMTDNEFLLDVLKDGKQHTGEEIVMLSTVKRGHGLTVHSRVASLRQEGWIIASKKVPKTRAYAYWLVGKGEGRSVVRKKEPPIVQGYIFRSEADVSENEKICQIVGRAEPDGETLEPAFLVRFTNGNEIVAWGSELRPWYAN